jgi:hypothetical protein
MGTPLTRMARYGVSDSVGTARTAGEFSPAAVNDSAQPRGVRLIASCRTSTNRSPCIDPSVGSTSARRKRPSWSNNDNS